jgi:fatty acid desaturase
MDPKNSNLSSADRREWRQFYEEAIMGRVPLSELPTWPPPQPPPISFGEIDAPSIRVTAAILTLALGFIGLAAYLGRTWGMLPNLLLAFLVMAVLFRSMQHGVFWRIRKHRIVALVSLLCFLGIFCLPAWFRHSR